MKSEANFIDESLVSTPRPTASSTVFKKNKNQKHVDRKSLNLPLNFSSTSEERSSLGVFALDDINASGSTVDESEILSRIRLQRQLAQSAIEKASKLVGLPSKYLKPDSMSQKMSLNGYGDHSTVSESDLLNRKESINSHVFDPNDMSTPRTTNVLETPLFQNITDMSEKIRNSDISLHDICSELQRASLGRFSTAQPSAIDGQTFMPAELMRDKFLKDEMSWRREMGVPGEKLRESIMSTISGSEKPSVGNFFQCRKNDLGEMFNTTSPEKLYPPSPLIDVTNTANITSTDIHPNATKTIEPTTNASLMSITQIAKKISELSCDTPNLVDQLLQNGKQQRRSRKSSNTYDIITISPDENLLGKLPHIEPKPKENDCDDYIEQKKLREGRSKSPNMDARTLASLNKETGRPRSLSPFENFEQMAPQARSSINSMESSVSVKISESGESCKCTSSGLSNSKENKENICEYASSVGSRCPSSLDSIPEGKLPIKGNKLEIVWGCIKVGRSSTQSLYIRNQLNQKIRMQVAVTGSSFRIVKERGDTEMLTSMIFVMHPLETKPLSIMFYPMNVGAVNEKLNFHPICNGEIMNNMKQSIKLYGYGGHIAIEMTKVAKDSLGKLWLSLGPLELRPAINQYFTIKNAGILSAFALLELTNDSVLNVVKVAINPTEMVIKPREEVRVNITYAPSKYDYRSQQEVIDVGSIKIITGAEAIRGRIRRLYKMLVQQKEHVDPLVETLSKELANEVIPTDLSIFTESRAVIKELLKQLAVKEIHLTIERNPDTTLIGPVTDFEDTTMYQTLYQDCTIVADLNNIKSNTTHQFRVEPSNIVFTLPYKKEDSIVLYSHCSSPMTFEVQASDGFTAYPPNGTILKENLVVIQITCNEMPHNYNGKVTIYVENEMMEVNLKALVIKKK